MSNKKIKENVLHPNQALVMQKRLSCLKGSSGLITYPCLYKICILVLKIPFLLFLLLDNFCFQNRDVPEGPHQMD